MYTLTAIKDNEVIDIVVPDGTTNTVDTSLTLIGRDATEYGEEINQNFIKLLSNNAGAVSPEQPLTGELWFNTLDQTLYVNGAAGFSVIGKPKWSQVPPSAGESLTGDLWINSNTDQLYIFNGSVYTVVGPHYTKNNGVTAIIEDTFIDVGGVPHVVGVVKVGDVDIGFYSNENFESLEYGIVLKGFNPSSNDVTFNVPVTTARGLAYDDTVIDAEQVAVREQDVIFADVSANEINAVTVSSNSIEIGSITAVELDGDLVFSSSITADTATFNSITVNGVQVDGIDGYLEAPQMTTELLESTIIKTDELAAVNEPVINVASPLLLVHGPSVEPTSAVPKSYVDQLDSDLRRLTVAISMHVASLDDETVKQQIDSYLEKLMPVYDIGKSIDEYAVYPDTFARVVAIKTTVSSGKVVSDYTGAKTYIYKSSTSGWDFVRVE